MKTYQLNAKVLDEWRGVTGMSVSDLARAIRVPQPSLWKWMNGKRAVPLDAAMELERVTCIPIRRLVTERNIIAPDSHSDRCAAQAEQILADATAQPTQQTEVA